MFKIETFEGIRYKVFLSDNLNGVSKVHIERERNSDVFENMTNDEIMTYVGAIVREVLNHRILGDPR